MRQRVWKRIREARTERSMTRDTAEHMVKLPIKAAKDRRGTPKVTKAMPRKAGGLERLLTLRVTTARQHFLPKQVTHMSKAWGLVPKSLTLMERLAGKILCAMRKIRSSILTGRSSAVLLQVNLVVLSTTSILESLRKFQIGTMSGKFASGCSGLGAVA